MKNLFLLLACFFSTSKLISQDDSIYDKEVIGFVRQVRNLNKWNEKIVLINEPEQRAIIEWQKRKLPSDNFFTKSDKEEIQRQLDKSIKYRWKYLYAGNAILLDSSKLMSIIFNGKGTGSGWWDFKETYKASYYYAFSVPIFLRNYKYCLFFSIITCGGLCSFFKLDLYEKEDGKWKIYKNLSEGGA